MRGEGEVEGRGDEVQRCTRRDCSELMHRTKTEGEQRDERREMRGEQTRQAPRRGSRRVDSDFGWERLTEGV